METPNDPFAFLKAAWPSFPTNGMASGLPQASLPTTDIAEIERRIADLKTVEQWLSLNLNILKTTIQGLEIQKGTLAAVKSWQSSMAEFGKPASKEDTENTAAPEAATQQQQWWWSSMQDQFNQLVQAAGVMHADGQDSSGGRSEPRETSERRKRSAGAATNKKPQAAPKSAKSRS